MSNDNARPHRAKIVTDFFEDKNIALWTHPPYSPDLNPLDYGCFSELKRMLRGNMFNSWDQLTSSLEDIFRQCKENEKFKSIRRLPER
ncbi:unnamed protein product [Euphydryas editha]|uniref:Tc1-like transposase DDE domain-containing protein n=1 Tax=Euphydryas editha TaxID=104508 RepID=A0AAU9V284_EUPED|nr:unnamed protein product [Euphydryas editha]